LLNVPHDESAKFAGWSVAKKFLPSQQAVEVPASSSVAIDFARCFCSATVKRCGASFHFRTAYTFWYRSKRRASYPISNSSTRTSKEVSGIVLKRDSPLLST
jgi:hypothetical protein